MPSNLLPCVQKELNRTKKALKSAIAQVASDSKVEVRMTGLEMMWDWGNKHKVQLARWEDTAAVEGSARGFTGKITFYVTDDVGEFPANEAWRDRHKDSVGTEPSNVYVSRLILEKGITHLPKKASVYESLNYGKPYTGGVWRRGINHNFHQAKPPLRKEIENENDDKWLELAERLSEKVADLIEK